MTVVSAAAIEITSTNEFCSSCHSMQAFTLPEYQDSIHYSNKHGFKAKCKDCHLPHNYVEKVVFKAYAGTRDMYHEFIARTISTKEKYEEHRLDMAEAVWARMRKNDSANCRYCHSKELMVIADQSRRARRAHENAFTAGEKTCIDCHIGVAHVAPTPELPGADVTGN